MLDNTENTTVENTSAVEATNTQATAQTNWLESISSDYRDGVTKFKSADELARGYINLQKLASSPDRILVPNENSSKETWDEYYNRLGRPASHDGYEFAAPEGVELDKDWIGAFREKAHAVGLSKKAAADLVGWYTERQLSQVEAEKTARAQADERSKADTLAELQRAWGNDYKDNMALAERAFKTYADEKDIAFMTESGMGNDPRIIRLFAKLGRGMLEDSDVTTKTAGLPESINAKQAIAQIRADKSHPYWNAGHTDHKRAVREMSELHAKAAAGN